ncbi:hypothetical protein [Arthrobacter sp. A2-55]|uniref:hypothetical protein n=1 Tax=Arthrobacter sp. A2-55 TaxID=2897337 RepID=UPI0021CDB9B9|nr:hypothetical protein [Arthrobacter sp. A2-55]MCU6478998.1 hypothetical protein [Arthrobacter sp. A2-55]
MSRQTNLAQAFAPLDDRFVLHNRQLHPATILARTARFKDDIWPLAPASLQGQERGLTLRFENIPARHRHALKLLAYTSLSGEIPSDEPRPGISSVVSTFYNAAVFLRWLDEYHSGRSLAQVSDETLLEFQGFLLGRYRSPGRRRALRATVVFFWRYRRSLGEESLSLDPRTVTGWKEPQNTTRFSEENTTARIPEDVHSRVLIWALRFVNDFADDILNATGRWEYLRTKRPSTPTAYGSNWIKVDRYLETARVSGRPLPGTNGLVSYAALARSIGCDRNALQRHTTNITATANEVGVSKHVELNITVDGSIDGAPWIEGVSLDPIRDDSLTVLTQMLQAACYIVIAFLSGMRDSEIKHLRAGCCTSEADSNGNIYRWKVSSLAFKGESTSTGVTATWIVGEAAARAIGVLERIHRERARNRTDWLFAAIKAGPGAPGRGDNKAMTLAGTNVQINRFVLWVTNYCAAHERIDGIPDVDGKPWRLSTRQFRRTLAWYIARRPGGSIAGAIAYRHHSVQMFEGYAGSSASGFRAEVEAEEALARGEHLLAMIDRNEHTSLTGPAADEAERRLVGMGADPAFAGTVTTDRRRLLRLIDAQAPAIYPGRYVTCVYNPDKALCRTRTGLNDDVPDMAHCKPLACRNVALTDENVGVWQDELAAINRELGSKPLLPPLLVTRLESRRQQIAHLLTRRQEPR